MFDLTGKTALVSGAASGIGAAIAKALAQAGAMVWVADRDASGGKAVAEQIVQANGRAASLNLDVTSEDSCEQAAASAGTVDILVNNAGVGTVGTILQTTGEELDRLYEVNVRGIFNLTKAILPGMISRESGNVINMASVGGVVGIRDRLAYCTTKFAVVGFTKSLALDHAASHIRCNCICPGRVETPFVQARLAEYPDPEVARQEMSATQLFGRMIQPDEIAAATLYLAADESFMVTGTTFMVDCGWSAGK
jgi:2-keto-3-deoxy-L-fuconate dehydrogenase